MVHKFAGYPTANLYDEPDGKVLSEILWGDYVEVAGAEKNGWVPVKRRTKSGWMKADELLDDRLLELYFVDIGQGDGALVVTPDDKKLLIDAGQFDNMLRFLAWRFGITKKNDNVVRFDAAVMSHSDQDHYKGFAALFATKRFKFNTVYHNGLMERAGDSLLGPTKKSGRLTYHTDLVADKARLMEILNDDAAVKGKQYPKMLKFAFDAKVIGDMQMLSTDAKNPTFVPGFGKNAKVSIEVLGPVTEEVDGKPALRRFDSDNGKTKNGHSVVLRLKFGQVSILLGGDLNIPAEKHLLESHTGLDWPDRSNKEDWSKFMLAAQETFRSDVAKACHHGSADFSYEFLRAVNAIATIVSSGDNEPHSHPRPDSLGTIGRAGRGSRPLIFSTELARSAPEAVNHPLLLRQEIRDLSERIDNEDDADKKEKLNAKLQKLLEQIQRSVAVYGLINVRTDGERVIIAQKLESKRGSTEWDIYELVPGEHGLKYESKYEDTEVGDPLVSA